MSAARAISPAASERVLRRLFWKLFFRGRAVMQARRNRKVGTWGSLVAYAIMGVLMSLSARWMEVAAYSAIMHGVCLAMVLLNMAASAGTFLFNQEESEILLHRPVTPGALLRAKATVLIGVALLTSFAFSISGLFMGSRAHGSNWLFLPAHLFSMMLLTVFAVSLLILVYNLCLRFFGRERLDNLMATAQTLFTLFFIMGSQMMPRLLNKNTMGSLSMDHWWHWLVPTSWFAAIDVLAVSQGGPATLWALSFLAITSTTGIAWLALHKLAGSYGEGLVALNETSGTRDAKPRRRWLAALAGRAPLKWWLRDPAERSSFLLCAAYIYRDREMKMRMFPGLAPMGAYMIMMFMIHGDSREGLTSQIMIAMGGAYFSFVPMLAMDFLRTSEQWRASDIFRIAPLPHWSPLFYGACKAVLLLFALPLMLVVAAFACWRLHGAAALLPLLPNALLLPLWTLMSGMLVMWLPLSNPFDQQKQSMTGCLKMAVVLGASMGVAALGCWALVKGWFWWLLAAEAVFVLAMSFALRSVIARKPWVEE